jgi:hypothetical protein
MAQEHLNPWRQGVWALLAACVMFWLVFAVMWMASVRRTDGHFVYVIDDTYITMAISRNVALHGVWGSSPEHFASCASSPLWVMLVAAVYFVAGPHQVVPLALNLVFGTALLGFLWAILQRRGFRPIPCFAVLTFVILATPLVPVAFTGLEHLLQTLVSLAFVWLAGESLAQARPPWNDSRAIRWLLALSPVLTLVRYEGAFLIAVVSLLFLVRKRVAIAVSLAALGALPIVVSGCIFLAKGWFFLPTSIALKANRPVFSSWNDFSGFLTKGWDTLRDNPHMSVLLGIAALALFLYGRRILEKPAGIMALVFLATAALHVQLASLGWFYRYEAYLVCLGIILAVFLLQEFPWQLFLAQRQSAAIPYAGVAFALLLLGLPVLNRAILAHARIPWASMNIYQQQYQMGLFLHEYYQGESIAANDIGAINYLADIRCFDLWGLSDVEVARLRLAGRYDTEAMRQLSHQKGVRIALVYDAWYEPYGGVPRQWQKAGQWTIPHNVICGGDTVSFYAVDPAAWASLRRHLDDFSRRLPRDVEVKLD